MSRKSVITAKAGIHSLGIRYITNTLHKGANELG